MSERSGLSPVLVRAAVALICGVLAAVAAAPFLGIAAGMLAGWATFAGIEVVWVLSRTWPLDAAATRAHARTEDPGRPAARIVALVGSLASLGGIALVLLHSDTAPRAEAPVLAAIAVAGAAASWAVIQVDFLLRLAAQYYADPEGGIVFPGTPDPRYSDFGYIAFTAGVAYGVTDTTIERSDLRRMLVGQSLLSYLFGAVILASIISLVTGL